MREKFYKSRIFRFLEFWYICDFRKQYLATQNFCNVLEMFQKIFRTSTFPKNTTQVSPIRMQPTTYDIIEVNLSAIVEILHRTKMANYIQFRAQCCQKYASHQKKLQIKLVWN